LGYEFTVMENLDIRTHRERPIPPRAVRELYDHVGWTRPASEEALAEVLKAGPAVGAWNRDKLVGFVRALSDGHLVAYVEDVMVHEGYRHSGVGRKLMVRLLEEIGSVAKVNLFCEAPVVRFYEGSGFRQTSYLLMQREKDS
jgi:ribosomal protein S18 acetylase RimI-like enzyme